MDNSKLIDESLNSSGKCKEVTKYKGLYRIFGLIVSNYNKSLSYYNIVGYIIMSEKTYQLKTFNVEQTKIILRQFKFSNAEFKLDGTIRCTECSIDRLPKIDSLSGKLLGYDNAIMIVGKILNKDNHIGFRVINHLGKVADMSEKELLYITSKSNSLIANAKKVTRGNNKEYISAIQGDFTIISKDDDSSNAKYELTAEKKSRNQAKLNKLRIWTYQVLRMALGLKHSAHTYFPMTLVHFNDWNNVEFQKLCQVYLTELIDVNTITSERDKQIYNLLTVAAYSDESKFKLNTEYKIVPKKEANNSNMLKFMAFAMCQLSLYDKELFNKCLNTDLKNKNKVIMDYTMHNLLQNKSIDSDILNRFIAKKEMMLSNKNYEEDNKVEDKGSREFKQTTFRTSREIANLGFAININNEHIIYTSPFQSKYDLKYIGKDIPYYDKYKKMANTFGDIGVLAQVMKTIECDYFCATEKWQRVEIMLAIMSLYRPDIVREFIKDNSRLYPALAKMLPELPENNEAIGKNISKEFEIYYSSAFNVFLNDNGHCANGMHDYREYSKKYLKESKYINYRSLGPKYSVNHSLLYDELAPIINMITSYHCDIETIEMCIGTLRVL